MLELQSELLSDDLLELSGNNEFIFKLNLLNFDKKISIKKNSNITIYLSDIDVNNLSFFVQENARLNLNIIVLNNEKSLSIHGITSKSSIFNVFFADFSNSNFTMNSNIILYGDDSKSEFIFSSLANDKNKKKYNISYSHLARNSVSNLNGFGVCLGDSELDVKGISHIEKGAIKSNASQHIKAILFDKTSKAKASPTLKIDCDDIKASHGCAIGSLNENHLYYLESRGINEAEARKLITYGYLLPITKYFNEESSKIIENRIYGSF